MITHTSHKTCPSRTPYQLHTLEVKHYSYYSYYSQSPYHTKIPHSQSCPPFYFSHRNYSKTHSYCSICHFRRWSTSKIRKSVVRFRSVFIIGAAWLTSSSTHDGFFAIMTRSPGECITSLIINNILTACLYSETLKCSMLSFAKTSITIIAITDTGSPSYSPPINDSNNTTQSPKTAQIQNYTCRSP